MQKKNIVKKIILTSLVALIILAATATFLAYWLVKRDTFDEKSVVKKSEQALETPASTELLFKREAFTLFGSVDRIVGNKIYFTLSDGYSGDLRQRVAILTDATVIDILRKKSEDEKKQDNEGVSLELKGLYEQAAKAKQQLYACGEKVANKSDISKVCLDESNRLYEISGSISDIERGAVPVKKILADLAELKGEMAIKVEADHNIYAEGEFQVSKIDIVVNN